MISSRSLVTCRISKKVAPPPVLFLSNTIKANNKQRRLPNFCFCSRVIHGTLSFSASRGVCLSCWLGILNDGQSEAAVVVNGEKSRTHEHRHTTMLPPPGSTRTAATAGTRETHKTEPHRLWMRDVCRQRV